jgi:hypothetical protein
MGLRRAALFVFLGCPVLASAQGIPGTSRVNPFRETSAGRAWQRLTFGAIDCQPGSGTTVFDCSQDVFTTSGVFVNGSYHDRRFQYGGLPAGTADSSDFLANRVTTQSQTFPQPSSASGFTFTWGSGSTPTLDSEFFGPLFGDRGRSIGRGKLSATLSVQLLKWETLDESDIRLGKPGLPWGDDAYSAAPDNSAIYGYVGRVRMNIDSVVTSLFLTYGITDRVDLTVGAPLVHTSVEGSNEFLDYARLPGPRLSIDPADTGFTPQGRYYVEGSSTGLGDVMVGFNWSFVKQPGTALALAGRVNVGTGSYEDMTGTGETQWSGGLVGSLEWGPFAPHFGVSYWSANDTLFDELRSVLGVDFRAVPNRLTLSAEFLSRRLFDVQGVGRTSDFSFGTVISPVTGDPFVVSNYQPFRAGYNLYLVSLGGKVRVAGQLLGTAFVLIPWGNSGLVAQNPSFNFGLSYVF